MDIFRGKSTELTYTTTNHGALKDSCPGQYSVRPVHSTQLFLLACSCYLYGTRKTSLTLGVWGGCAVCSAFAYKFCSAKSRTYASHYNYNLYAESFPYKVKVVKYGAIPELHLFHRAWHQVPIAPGGWAACCCVDTPPLLPGPMSLIDVLRTGWLL